MNTDDCLCTGLRQAAFAVTEIYDTHLHAAGIKVTMFRIIRRLSMVGEATIKDLAKIVGVDSSTLGRNLKVLERMDLIAFKSGTDGRTKLVEVTAAGTEMIERATPLWLAAQRELHSRIGADLSVMLNVVGDLRNHHVPAESA